MSAIVHRRFALLLVPCALVSGFADAQTAAPSTIAAPSAVEVACDGTDLLSRARCQRAQLVRSTCDDVPDGARGHCVRCILANNPLSCDALPPTAAAQCRAQESAIERCADGPMGEADACLRDAGVALTDRSTARSRFASRFLATEAAP